MVSAPNSFPQILRQSAGGENEFHLVLLDNGRSRILRDPVGRGMFRCIRCGAYANICPVYRNVGGFAYGWFIPAPGGRMPGRCLPKTAAIA